MGLMVIFSSENDFDMEIDSSFDDDELYEKYVDELSDKIGNDDESNLEYVSDDVVVTDNNMDEHRISYEEGNEPTYVVFNPVMMADERDAEAVRRCLSKFESWSSQKVNERKSFMPFSNNVPNRTRRIILETLQMPECNHKAKHLGFPFCKQNSKIWLSMKSLENVKQTCIMESKEPVTSRENGSHKVSCSVTPSVPNVQLSPTKKNLSQTGCHCSAFLVENGSKEEKKHFLALRSWQAICQQKNKGGLGFRKFADFNKALVSKICWNISQKSDKLWCQVIRAKYLKNNTVLESSLQVASASWTWQDAVKCAKIIKAGICFNVSTHTAITIWEDPWIPSIQCFTPKPPTNLNPEWPTLVHDLIDQNANQWNLELLNQMFSNEIEDAHHLFLGCLFTERVWLLSKWQVRLHPLSHLSLREWFLQITTPDSNFFPDRSIQQEFITTWAITLELIWRERNDRVHCNGAHAPEEIARTALNKSIDHCMARAAKKSTEQIYCAWSPPPPGWIKINSNVSLKDNKCVAAFTIRDHFSTLISAEAKEIFASDPSVAELKAIRMAVSKIHADNVEHAILESDSAVAVKWIKNKAEEIDQAALIDVQEIRKI
ncbi:UNVERIFIED_CONTAM: hypothetical protein Sradi_5270700 [Sesamum radiatum]|uniref:RNase H type-1 domain-containing protein n=1 Tax=Sesamum radiatum TaxID=300843 RepID=A0AAW2LMW7_SESRA